jgi:hypothetical protein
MDYLYLSSIKQTQQRRILSDVTFALPTDNASSLLWRFLLVASFALATGAAVFTDAIFQQAAPTESPRQNCLPRGGLVAAAAAVDERRVLCASRARVALVGDVAPALKYLRLWLGRRADASGAHHVGRAPMLALRVGEHGGSVAFRRVGREHIAGGRGSFRAGAAENATLAGAEVQQPGAACAFAPAPASHNLSPMKTPA